MIVTLQDRERLNTIGAGLEDILDTVVASVQAGWDVEHTHAGRHNNVTAVSVSASGAYYERDRPFAIGARQSTPPSVAGVLSATGGAVWTSAASPEIQSYVMVGDFLLINCYFNSCSISVAAPVELGIRLPLALTTTGEYGGAFVFFDPGAAIVPELGWWTIAPSATVLRLFRGNGAAFPISVNTTFITLQALVGVKGL